MKKAAWVIPSFIEGSGGYRTIFQHINHMSKQYICDVYCFDSGDFKDVKQLRSSATSLYGECYCNFYLGFSIKEELEYDLVIATAWITAEVVRQFRGSAEKLYFVQDYEPFFYPVGNEYLEAANSYNFGLKHITIGRWLSWKLQKEHNALTNYFDFCADKTVYKRLEKIEKQNAVCFIYQPEKPRRSCELGLKALYIVKKMMPDVTIYLYGSDKKGNTPMDCVNKGIISLDQCNRLYNTCKVGLCISATNPSRIPFEMMAAGLPVVDIYRENNLFDYPQDGILLAQSRPEAIAQAIINILNDTQLQYKMSTCGQNFMKSRNMEYGMKQFMDIIDRTESESYSDKHVVQMTYTLSPVIASKDLLHKCDDFSLGKIFENNNLLSKLKHIRWIRNFPGIKKLGSVLKNV